MRILFYIFFIPGFLSILYGLPGTKEIVVGEVSFSELDKKLSITASDGAIISYPNGFDISSGETVQFIQPSTSARVLNQIYGENASQINGNLQSNGHVYLLNSAGIIFGENSVVEVGKLSAIAGSLSNSDFSNKVENYTNLSGEIQNLGSIIAEEIVFAGSSISNTGTIIAENGMVILAAGGELSLQSEGSGLIVELSENQQFYYHGMASDVAGQALLQSGVLEASKAEFHGKEITISGKTQSTDLTLGNFDKVNAGEGAILTNRLILNGLFQSHTSPTADLSSKNNQISQLLPSGNFQSIKVRSAGGLSIGDLTEPVNFSSQVLDVRIAEGDLSVYSLPTPLVPSQENSILLAAEGQLVVNYDIGQLNYDRMLLYGTNLNSLNYQKIETKPDNLQQLDATTLTLDDLSLDFTSANIQKLVAENPSFTGFSLEGIGIAELSSEGNQQESQSVASAPAVTSVSNPQPFNFTSPGNMPNFSPISESTPYSSLSGNVVNDSVLNLASSFGLFGNYSYYLRAPTSSERLTNLFASFGGASALFGGSYGVLSADTSTQQSDSSSESDSESSSQESSDQAVGSAKIKGAIPFAPIGLPQSSSEAAEVLESSLGDEIESKLGKYHEK